MRIPPSRLPLALLLTGTLLGAACAGSDRQVAVPGVDDPGSTTAPAPGGDPAPTPEPDPTPDPEPTPEPDPAPAPDPDPAPAPESGSAGVVTVDGVAYPFTPQVCIDQLGSFGSFIAEGPGVTAEGRPYWAGVEIEALERSTAASFGLDETTIAALFPDGTDQLQEPWVRLDFDRTDAFADPPEGSPRLEARISFGAPTFGSTLDYSVDGGTVSGSGQITDLESVFVPLGETVPFSYSASC